jgi:hypothetical protein
MKSTETACGGVMVQITPQWGVQPKRLTRNQSTAWIFGVIDETCANVRASIPGFNFEPNGHCQ